MNEYAHLKETSEGEIKIVLVCVTIISDKSGIIDQVIPNLYNNNGNRKF